MAARYRRPIFGWLMTTQLAVLGVLSGLGWGLGSLGDAVSILLGGGVALIANGYFAWRMFRHRGGRHARRMVSSLYRAEAGKFGLTVALFVAVFIAVPPSNHALFFGVYVVMLFVHWLAAWLGTRPLPH